LTVFGQLWPESKQKLACPSKFTTHPTNWSIFTKRVNNRSGVLPRPVRRTQARRFPRSESASSPDEPSSEHASPQLIQIFFHLQQNNNPLRTHHSFIRHSFAPCVPEKL